MPRIPITGARALHGPRWRHFEVSGLSRQFYSATIARTVVVANASLYIVTFPQGQTDVEAEV